MNGSRHVPRSLAACGSPGSRPSAWASCPPRSPRPLTRLADLGYSQAYAAHAIGSGSLLVRTEEGTFRFIHESIMEWLVAKAAGADLTGADLREVRMTGGSLADAVLTGSTWDRSALLGVAGAARSTAPELAAAAIPGREPEQVMLRTGGAPWCVAFSPDPDLPLLAVGSGSTAEIVDPRDGTVLRVLRGHTASVIAVAFSPDGVLLATGSHDGTTRIWDVGS